MNGLFQTRSFQYKIYLVINPGIDISIANSRTVEYEICTTND